MPGTRTVRLAALGADARLLLPFAAVGASGFVLDFACYLALQWLGLDHRLARALAFWPAVTWNWFLNREVTFARRPRGRRAAQWSRFVLCSLVGLTLNAGSYAALTTFVPYFDAHHWQALVLGVALGSVANFALASHWAYRPPASDLGARGRRVP